MRRRKLYPEAILFLLTLLIFALIFSYSDSTSQAETIVKEPPYQPRLEYGINVDSSIIVKDKVKPNQSLSTILSSYGVSPLDIDILAKRCKDVFNVRTIKAGNKYTVIHSADSVQPPDYLIYESSPTTYVVFCLKDSLHVHLGSKEVTTKIQTASGIITTSLWNAMSENGIDFNLALELSEIYAWVIDFYGIQKGDFFKVIFEELYVDDEYIGLGKIFGSQFNHVGKDYYAVYYIQDSVGDYFDENAQSVRREFLKAPLRFSRISSRFSGSRLHPILKIRRPHYGVDYAAPYGTPVHSIGDGTVIFAGRKGGAGRIVKIKHNGTYTTAYMHLSKFGKGIRSGVRVKQGDLIGYVGSSGLSTGPHLDFRFYKNGSPVDPLKVESPPALPVKKENIDDYNSVKNRIMKQLNSFKGPELLSAKQVTL